MWLSMALLLTSKRASPTLCCFRESSSSQAAPLPDRVRGRAAVLECGGSRELLGTCSLVGPAHFPVCPEFAELYCWKLGRGDQLDPVQ